MMSGRQCTVAWYVNNIKISHENQRVLEDLLTLLNDEFGKEAPLTITQGKNTQLPWDGHRLYSPGQS